MRLQPLRPVKRKVRDDAVAPVEIRQPALRGEDGDGVVERGARGAITRFGEPSSGLEPDTSCFGSAAGRRGR